MARTQATSDLLRILAQYREALPRYSDFCESMRGLLVGLLESRHFKYQASSRVKSLESVREKIVRNARRGKTYRRLGDIEDLAGIRIVFYLEKDKRRFLSLLSKELTRGKLTIEDHRKDSGYRATHVLAQYGRKRLALNEYRRFAGMKCELQLTSALFHAWSEIEHDILYKRCRPLRPLPRTVVQALKEQLNRAMEHHIQPASEILEAAARQAMRARPGG